MRAKPSLTGRVAIVPTNGLDRAMALGLAGAGTTVVATATHERSEVEEGAAEAGAPGRFLALLTNVTENEDWGRIAATALERFGRLMFWSIMPHVA